MTKKDYIVGESLTITYDGIPAVDEASFRIPKGSITAIIGPNGAGKSTLAKIIMGLIEPEHGSITIGGKNPRSMRKRIGYVPQRFEYNKHIPITVSEFLSLSLSVLTNGKGKLAIVEERLKDVGLGKEILKKQLSELSGGQLQRMLIARALLTEKDLLIMDEPVASLDIEGRQSVHELLKELNKKHSVTILLISHELEVVFQYADNVLCMHRRLLCHGRPNEALTQKVLKEMYGDHHQAHYHHTCND